VRDVFAVAAIKHDIPDDTRQKFRMQKSPMKFNMEACVQVSWKGDLSPEADAILK
jgi:hypothetical protein